MICQQPREETFTNTHPEGENKYEKMVIPDMTLKQNAQTNAQTNVLKVLLLPRLKPPLQELHQSNSAQLHPEKKANNQMVMDSMLSETNWIHLLRQVPLLKIKILKAFLLRNLVVAQT